MSLDSTSTVFDAHGSASLPVAMRRADRRSHQTRRAWRTSGRRATDDQSLGAADRATRWPDRAPDYKIQEANEAT